VERRSGVEKLYEIDGIAARKCSFQISPSPKKSMWPGKQYEWSDKGNEGIGGDDPGFAISRFVGNYQVWFQRPPKGQQGERSGPSMIEKGMPEQ